MLEYNHNHEKICELVKRINFYQGNNGILLQDSSS